MPLINVSCLSTIDVFLSFDEPVANSCNGLATFLKNGVRYASSHNFRSED